VKRWVFALMVGNFILRTENDYWYFFLNWLCYECSTHDSSTLS